MNTLVVIDKASAPVVACADDLYIGRVVKAALGFVPVAVMLQSIRQKVESALYKN